MDYQVLAVLFPNRHTLENPKEQHKNQQLRETHTARRRTKQ